MRLVKKLLVGLCCAALATSITAVVLAQDEPPDPDSGECIGCHEGLRTYWDQSDHAQAFADEAFQTAWQEQGKPQACLACHTTGYDAETGTYLAEGIDCIACHNPVPSNHPDQYIPTDVSSRQCGTCHVETFSEWEQSNHAQEDMACGQCHNPHTADLRVENTQILCQTCHEDQSHYYSFTGHASEGLLCTDCHLNVDESAAGEGHGSRQHTFQVDFHTCNRCHETDMHSAVEDQVAMSGSTEQVACYRTDTVRVPATPEQPLHAEPVKTDTHPAVYVLPAGAGLILGVIVAPWAEGLVRRRKGDE